MLEAALTDREETENTSVGKRAAFTVAAATVTVFLCKLAVPAAPAAATAVDRLPCLFFGYKKKEK